MYLLVKVKTFFILLVKTLQNLTDCLKNTNNSTRASVIKSVTTEGRGVKNYQKLRDVIYEQPLTQLNERVIPNPS